MSDSENDSHTPYVARIAIKPPPFYRKSPETWFRQLESQFSLAGVTSQRTQFHHALAALPEEIACDLDPALKLYNDLKEAILTSLRANRFQLIEEALASVQLNERRPAQFVIDIKRRFAEVGLKADEAVIKSRLLSALPPSLRSALVAHEDSDIDTFAKIADSMLAVTASDTPFTVRGVHHDRGLAQQRPPGSKNFAPRPFHATQRPKVCNAHIYYGSKARTCRSWCQWPEKNLPIVQKGNRTPRQSRAASPESVN